MFLFKVEGSGILSNQNFLTSFTCAHPICTHIPSTKSLSASLPAFQPLPVGYNSNRCIGHNWQTEWLINAKKILIYSLHLLCRYNESQINVMSYQTMRYMALNFHLNISNGPRNDNNRGRWTFLTTPFYCLFSGIVFRWLYGKCVSFPASRFAEHII